MMRAYILTLLLVPLLLSAQTYDVTDFGALGNGSTLNTQAIQDAIDTCTITGGTVLIPQGTFVTGTVFLKDNVTLEINGTLEGSTNINDYPDVIPGIRTYTDNYPQRSIIYAENVHHIKLTGQGTIDGNGVSFLNESENRPYGMRFISCQNVTIENLELRNSGFWMMHNLNIDTLTIRDITIYNHSNSNNDGINVDACRNVLVENCTVDSNDDPLVLKTTTPLMCENVVARQCTVATWSRAIKIGTETNGGFRNIHLHDITVQWSSVQLQPLFGTATCGINLSIMDGGFMEDVTVENVTMEGIETPILLRLGNRGRKYTDTASTPGVGHVQDVVLRNITATAETNITSTVTGIPGHALQDITLEDIQINLPGGEAAVPPGFIVPENEDAKPENDLFGQTLPAYGLYIRHVDNITMDNICFTYDDPDNRDAIVTDDVTASNSFSIVDSGANTTCLKNTTSITSIQGVKGFEIITDYAGNAIQITGAEDGLLRIFDMKGTIHKNVELSGYPDHPIGLGMLAPGIYIVTLQDRNGFIRQRKFYWQ